MISMSLHRCFLSFAIRTSIDAVISVMCHYASHHQRILHVHVQYTLYVLSTHRSILSELVVFLQRLCALTALQGTYGSAMIVQKLRIPKICHARRWVGRSARSVAHNSVCEHFIFTPPWHHHRQACVGCSQPLQPASFCHQGPGAALLLRQSRLAEAAAWWWRCCSSSPLCWSSSSPCSHLALVKAGKEAQQEMAGGCSLACTLGSWLGSSLLSAAALSGLC